MLAYTNHVPQGASGMYVRKTLLIAASLLLSATAFSQPTSAPVLATSQPPADYESWPTTEGTTILSNFHFGSGETLPQLKLHYLTLGTKRYDKAGRVSNAVLLLHGTGGNAHSLLVPAFSNVLFAGTSPLDISKYYLILPDDIGLIVYLQYSNRFREPNR